MDQSQLKWIADFIWNFADDRLRDVYVRGKYRDVILPFIVLRRLDALLEPIKQAVLAMKKLLDAAQVANQDGALRSAACQALYNTAATTLADLQAIASGQRLRNSEACAALTCLRLSLGLMPKASCLRASSALPLATPNVTAGRPPS